MSLQWCIRIRLIEGPITFFGTTIAVRQYEKSTTVYHLLIA